MNVIALAEKLLGRTRGSKYDKPDVDPKLSTWWNQVVPPPDSQLVVPLGANPVQAALRKTLGNNLFFLEYQPIFNLAGKAIEVEALLRSHDPLLRKIGPSGYIRVAEESNLILPVGERVLLMACSTQAEWRSLGLHDVTVAVNVSCTQLVSPGFAEFALRLFEKHELPPSAIHMEITETMLPQDPSSMFAQMTTLAEAGVCFSIDDFGSGFSTLERLSWLPISTMTIDQSFVREIQSNSRMFLIVRGMVDLARHVGMDVIAEGVETEEHFERLHAVGCERFQGYLFSRPMEAPCVRELLVANHLLLPDPITTFGNGSRWRTRVREVTGVSTTAEPT